MTTLRTSPAARRDPAWVGRLFVLLSMGVLAWPLLAKGDFPAAIQRINSKPPATPA